MKVLLANLPGVKLNNNGTFRHYAKAGSRWPMTVGYTRTVDYYPFPFWLAYTTALLKRDTKAKALGLDGVVLDMTHEEFFKEVQSFSPDLLITEFVLVNLKDDLELLKNIKEKIGCQIGIAGNYATVYPKSILQENEFIDYIFLGEYELTVKELVTVLTEKRSFKDIKGLAFRQNKELVVNERRALISNLDILPFPDRYDFPAVRYYDFSFYSPCISIMASRGCPLGCIFCTDRHIMYDSAYYRKRKSQNIADEMELCISQFGARQFYFDDMSFTIDKNYVEEICDEILRRKINIPWTCMGDAMFVDYVTLKKMKEAGCIGIKFGIESANPGILKKIKKPLDLQKAKEVVRWCKQLGIISHATYCLGLPGENKETVKQTIKFAKELDSDTFQVSKAVPYPGTPLYAWLDENGYLKTYDLNSYDCASSSIINYNDFSFEEIDYYYKIFTKFAARHKIKKYLSQPLVSLSFIYRLILQKGIKGAFYAIYTFLKRGL
jgi:radical SAM superfamily enzyme YgiQ (UPF0313 family)